MDILNKYPELKNKLEFLLQTKRNEILSQLLESNNEYKTLCNERTQASMAVKNMLAGSESDILFEVYSDAIYAQEVYELNSVYRQGFIDAIIALQEEKQL